MKNFLYEKQTLNINNDLPTTTTEQRGALHPQITEIPINGPERQKHGSTKPKPWPARSPNPKIKQRLTKRIFASGTPRKDVLNTHEGIRSLSIASINPDNFILEKAQTEITEMLLRNKIHIEAIQETHIPRDLNYKLNGYRIITTAEIQGNKEHDHPNRGLSTAGVAILVHGELEHHIVNIKRADARIMKITLHIKQSHTPLTILFTYAPHGGKTK